MEDTTRDGVDEPGAYVPPAEPDERANLLASIGEIHEEIKADQHLDCEIPGYRGLLWGRFRPYPVAQTEQQLNKIRRVRNQPMLLRASMDVLVNGCEQLLLLPAKYHGEVGQDGENLIPIDDAGPIGFDARLEPVFNLVNPSKTAYGVIQALFATEQSIISLATRVQEWMNDVNAESQEDLLGESDSTQR